MAQLFLKLALPDEDGKHSGSWQTKLNLGIPIHHDLELKMHIPSVVNPAPQILLVLTFFERSDSHAAATMPHFIAVLLSDGCGPGHAQMRPS